MEPLDTVLPEGDSGQLEEEHPEGEERQAREAQSMRFLLCVMLALPEHRLHQC